MLCIKKVFLVICFFLLFRVKGSKKNGSVLALVMISRMNLLKAARVTVEVRRRESICEKFFPQ